MEREEEQIRVGEGYPYGQLSKAFVTALTHADPETGRGPTGAWPGGGPCRGMASGKLTIGSRKPVDDLPVWATPEVVRGGFATGAPAAAAGDQRRGPL